MHTTMHGAASRRFWPGAIVLLALSVIMSGCAGDSEPRVERIELSGRIFVPDGVESAGTVYVGLYHAWALEDEGDLRHPVEFIEAFEARPGSYTHEFDYPVDLGDGLLVYAWIDTDGDGVLCTPTTRSDRAGLVDVADFGPGAVTADITLAMPCAGPEWFFPPPE